MTASHNQFSRRAFFKSAASGLALSFVSGAVFAKAAPDTHIEGLIKSMTLEEKAGQLSIYGDTTRADYANVNPEVAAWTKNNREKVKQDIAKGLLTGLFNGFGAEGSRELQEVAMTKSRLKIPLIFAADIIHGLRTVFPIPIAEACSFDPDLCERTARAAALEGSALGVHWTFAPMVDVARDQRWGRVAEGAGEDTYLGRIIAAARVKGFQGKSLKSDTSLLACCKHFAAYGAVEGGMEYNTADIPETTLRQVHLPPFKSGVDAGVMSFMSSFNDIAGVPSTGNHYLLTTILREQWGFRGLVVSDYTSEEEMILHGFAADGREATKKAIMAGCDMAMQSGLYVKHLPDLVRKGEVPMSVVDESVRRVLKVKKALGLFENPYKCMDSAREKTDIYRVDTVALAREAARKSVVLLKNDNALLPLPKSGKKIALIGPCGSDIDGVVGAWSVSPDRTKGISLEVGLRNAMSNPNDLIVVKGADMEAPLKGGIEAAVAAAAAADVVVLAIGETDNMSGEAQSRVDIKVPDAQQALADAVAATGKPIVVVLRHGRALALHGAVRDAQAILATWFLGSETGNGMADLIFGDYAPSGRLVVSFPQESGQEPLYYNHRRTGRPQLTEDKNYKARYREVTNDPLYPFGHGLTYSTARYGATGLSKSKMAKNDVITVSAKITNTGNRAMREVAQLYIHDKVASLTQPVRLLKGFAAIELAPGETREVSFKLTHADLAFVHSNLRSYAETGDFDIWIAPSSIGGEPATLSLVMA